MADKACVCFERLVESFLASSERLAILASAGLIPNMLALMKGTCAAAHSVSPYATNSSLPHACAAKPRVIQASTFTLCAHTLARLCAKCPALAATFHDHDAAKVRAIG